VNSRSFTTMPAAGLITFPSLFPFSVQKTLGIVVTVPLMSVIVKVVVPGGTAHGRDLSTLLPLVHTQLVITFPPAGVGPHVKSMLLAPLGHIMLNVPKVTTQFGPGMKNTVRSFAAELQIEGGMGFFPEENVKQGACWDAADAIGIASKVVATRRVAENADKRDMPKRSLWFMLSRRAKRSI
jgi:hypothetical protein